MLANRPRRARYFTPDEANDALPGVIEKMESARERVTRYHALIARVREGLDDDERARTMRHARALRQEATEILADIEDLGVEVKGLREGLLDFPALRNGQEVFLCWREGDRRVEWWHPLHTGIAGRQRVNYGELGRWEWCN